MPHSGSCLCGAVKFSFTTPVSEALACHCSMCRKWSGGIVVSVEVPAEELTIEQGGDTIRIYTSSDWGERAFCPACGSGLWFRFVAPGPQPDIYYINMGTLDNTDGITVTQELFIDAKPDGYALAGDHICITAAQYFASFENARDNA